MRQVGLILEVVTILHNINNLQKVQMQLQLILHKT